MLTSRRPLSTFGILVRRRALMEGVFGNDRAWRVVAAVLFGRSLMKKLFGRTTEVLTIERLAPGQGMVLRTIPYVSRRARRRAARARRVAS